MSDRWSKFSAISETISSVAILEAWELDGYMQTVFIAREFVWLRYKEGSIDTVTFETMMKDLTYFLSNPRLNEWWKKNAKRVFEEDFVKYVNSRSEE